jgi:hypothetical protein
MGRVVVFNECDCSGDTYVPAEGALKTGLAIVANAKDSVDATEAKYDITIAAVTVDDGGVIQDCIIDSVGAKVEFDDKGVITSDLSAEILTKNELGDKYGMKAYGNAKYEWYEQAQALADAAIGKDASEVAAIDVDLVAGCTIYAGGYKSVLEKAAKNVR